MHQIVPHLAQSSLCEKHLKTGFWFSHINLTDAKLSSHSMIKLYHSASYKALRVILLNLDLDYLEEKIIALLIVCFY